MDLDLQLFPRTIEADRDTPNLSGRDSESERPPGYSPAESDTPGVARASQVPTPNHIYYRIYTEDGAIPSNTAAVAPGDPFLGRIKVGSVPPPRTAKTVKRYIAKLENIKDRGSTSLFLTLYSKSPMDDAEKFTTIFNGTAPGSTLQEPLALVANMSESERSALASDGRASAAEPDTTPPPGIRYLYYQLFADDSEMASKVAFDPEQPSLGRIRVDSIVPPHSPTSIKCRISRVERNPALVNSDLFAGTACDTPLTDGHIDISIFRTDGPGLSPNEPMAIVQADVQVESPLPTESSLPEESPLPTESPLSVEVVTSIPNGRYIIKNRAVGIYMGIDDYAFTRVNYFRTEMYYAKKSPVVHWDTTQDAHGNITMTCPRASAPSLWIGAELLASVVPVPWRLIPADGESYYLTTDVNRVSQNPRVPASHGEHRSTPGALGMATLKEGDQTHMWEFYLV